MYQQQMLLDFVKKLPSYKEFDFIPSKCNKEALELVYSTENWISPVAFVVGESGSGKTHLAHIFANRNNATFINNFDAKIEHDSFYVIDDFDKKIYKDASWEEYVFGIYNTLKFGKGKLLLVSRLLPKNLEVTLNDLKTRINQSSQAVIEAIDDDLFAILLYKIPIDYQRELPANAMNWFVLHFPRSTGELVDFLEFLDYYAARAYNQKINKNFIKECFNLWQKRNTNLQENQTDD